MSPIEIQNLVKNLPSLPGVYRFYGAGDIPLYIGKAKVLKNRVSSYFLEHRLSDNPRLQLMVSQIVRVDYTVVSTEKDALILEANLIHNLQPKFNILLKDDRNYLYVRITHPNQKVFSTPKEKHKVGDNYGNVEGGVNENKEIQLNYDKELYEVRKNLNFVPFYTYQNQVPTITLTRRKYDKGGEYFGPYTKKYGIFNVLRILRTIFPYCDKKISDGKCCQYVQIKQCDGICCGLEDIDSYNSKIEQIKKVLRGDTDSVKVWLKDKISEAIDLNNYELAALWRDRLNILDEVVADQKVILPHPQNLDIFTFLVQKDKDGFTIGSVFVQNIRDGKIINVNNFLISGTSGLDDQELFELDEIEIESESEDIDLNQDIFGMCQSFLVEYFAQQKGAKPEILINIWKV
jgi:excinuclease ABC subunit C